MSVLPLATLLILAIYCNYSTLPTVYHPHIASYYVHPLIVYLTKSDNVLYYSSLPTGYHLHITYHACSHFGHTAKPVYYNYFIENYYKTEITYMAGIIAKVCLNNVKKMYIHI